MLTLDIFIDRVQIPLREFFNVYSSGSVFCILQTSFSNRFILAKVFCIRKLCIVVSPTVGAKHKTYKRKLKHTQKIHNKTSSHTRRFLLFTSSSLHFTYFYFILFFCIVCSLGNDIALFLLHLILLCIFLLISLALLRHAIL